MCATQRNEPETDRFNNNCQQIYSGQRMKNHKVQTPFAKIFFVFLSFFLFCCSSGPPPEMTDPGALIYYGYVSQDAQCSRCHGDEGQGGMFGPSIRDIMQKRSVERVRDIIANGKGEGDKKMPDFAGALTPAQIEQVIRFLQTWNITAPADSVTADFVH